MKCLNMKVGDVVFSLANLMLFYSVNVRPNVVPTSQSTISWNEVLESKFERECPQILKIIHDNNLTDYTINCKSTHTDIVTVENVLQQACFIVKVMFGFMCESKANVSTSLVSRDNVTSICPFDFSHLNQLGVQLSNHNLVKELTTKVQCSKVCDDLYSYKNQCVVLSQVNNYMKNLIPQRINVDTNPPDRGNFPVESDHMKAKTENNLMSTTQEKDGQSVKIEVNEALVKESNETTLDSISKSAKAATKIFKEPKTDITSTTRAENLAKDNMNVSRNKNFLHEEDELEDPNEGFEDTIKFQTNDFLSPRSDLGQGEKISDSPPKGKKIYPGEGFFQAEDSHFFFYFIMVSSVIVISYLAFHNKNKVPRKQSKIYSLGDPIGSLLYVIQHLISLSFSSSDALTVPTITKFIKYCFKFSQILAYALEGSSARRNRRRPNPARYRKLETNLEEAISSCATSSAAASVVY